MPARDDLVLPDGGFFGSAAGLGAQAEAIRVPLADGTLVKVPGSALEDAALLPSLLTLSDVYGTGYHAALRGGVTEGSTVAAIGDGAVGLLSVLAAAQLGAGRIVLIGRHAARTDLGRAFGATDVIAERGQDGTRRLRELTGGEGADIVIEAVGLLPAYLQAIDSVRPGGTISRVGLPQYDEAPVGASLFVPNITLTGGTAQVRAHIDELLPAVLAGTAEPGRVFYRVVPLEDIAEGYRAMADREALKVMVRI